MLGFLPPPIKGTLASLLVLSNTIFWCLSIYPLALLKLIPVESFRLQVSRIMVFCAESWISGNSFILNRMQKVHWQVEGLETLNPERSYLLLVNHQSWVDIVVLQHHFNRRIPFLRFFLKSELIWVPFLGLAWWALDFPFMKRHSKEYLAKHPEKRGQDLQATKRACEKLRGLKISILNFAEGTRFSQSKHDRQKSPYTHLLKPKAGGIAFVLQAMGGHFHSLLDVTLIYPGQVPTFWGLLSGRLGAVRMIVREIEIPRDLMSSGYLENSTKRVRAADWVQGIWVEKDKLIEAAVRPTGTTL